MSPALDKLADDKRLMAYTAAAMYGGAAFDGAIEGLIPGDPSFAVAPVIAAALVVSALVAFGPRLPRRILALLGPIGVILIASALSAVPAAGDGGCSTCGPCSGARFSLDAGEQRGSWRAWAWRTRRRSCPCPP